MKDVIELINKIAKTKNKNINLTQNDLNKSLRDLKIDSLAAMTLIIDLENELKITIPDEKLNQLKTLKDLVDIVIQLKKAS